DFHVTGVQTCALPIFTLVEEVRVRRPGLPRVRKGAQDGGARLPVPGRDVIEHAHGDRERIDQQRGLDLLALAAALSVEQRGQHRSEERRVVREWRSRW